MVVAINGNAFDGQRRVTCYTCHRGSAKPVGTPLIGEPGPAPPSEDPSSAPDPGVGLPGVDQLLTKYVAALGGVEALQKISTRVEEGTVTVAGRQFRFEALAKSPDRRVSIMRLPNGESITAYDGHAGWLAVPGRPAREMTGSELDAARFDAEFVPAVRLKQSVSDLRVVRLSDVAGRKAYLMMGLEGGQLVLQGWFDAQSGLLLRLVRYEESPLGRNPTQIDFGDYRSADGVKHPFRRILTRARGGFTIQVEKVQHNVPIDDRRFVRPEGGAAP